MIQIIYLCLAWTMVVTGIASDSNEMALHSDIDFKQAFRELRFIMEEENKALRAELYDLRQKQNGDRKRLVLHSDFDLDQAFRELRQEINSTQQENKALRAELEKLRKAQGSSYVRWGRTVCSGNGTEKVYSGYAGGSQYDAAAGASSNICLPQTPSWAHYVDGIQSLGGYVFGTEYESESPSPAFGNAAFGKHMQDNDAPCVVCRSPRPVTIMIPGSTSCNVGWTLEYSGYLMTDHHTHKAGTDYACVDKDPEAVLHGEADQNGHLFYFTEVQCGSLPCQEYPQGRELACVVCSK